MPRLYDEDHAHHICKTTKRYHQRYSDAMNRTKMLADFRKSIKAWNGEGKFPPKSHMHKVYANDREKLQRIYDLFRKGDYALAAHKAFWLDTIVRDQIPLSVYNEIS